MKAKLNHKITLKDISNKIDIKFDGIDKKFDNIDNKFNIIDQKFEKVDKHLSLLTDKLIDLSIKQSEDMSWVKENLVTKTEFNELKNTTDHIVFNVNKLNEDHVFVIAWLKRLQVQCDQTTA